MTTLAIGQLLRGKYRIKRILGEGGMGVVVRATHLRLDRDVAIKMLRPGMSHDPSIVARFGREARSAARLVGDHVVKVLDVDDSEGGAPFLVMEYLEGRDLEAVVRHDGPLDASRAADYALQALEGLAQAHLLGIVHRDVKPANLFLAKTERGEMVKLLDFGVSKAMEVGDPNITQADRILGSPSFMSPEQAKASRDVDARTDLWSIGVVLFFLLTRKLPFAGDTAVVVAANIASEAPADLDELCPDLPAGFADVVRRCMEKDRTKRYASAAEVANALAPFTPRGAEAAERIAKILATPPPREEEPEVGTHGLPYLPGTDPGVTTSTALGLAASDSANERANELPKIPGTDVGATGEAAKVVLPKLYSSDSGTSSSKGKTTRPEGRRAALPRIPGTDPGASSESSLLPLPATDVGMTRETPVERPDWQPNATTVSSRRASNAATRSRAIVVGATVLGAAAIAVLARSGASSPTTPEAPSSARATREAIPAEAAALEPALSAASDGGSSSPSSSASGSASIAVSVSTAPPALPASAPAVVKAPAGSASTRPAPKPAASASSTPAPTPFDLDLK